MGGLWSSLATLSYGSGAAAALACAVWLHIRREQFGNAGRAMIVAMALTALWAVSGLLTISGLLTLSGGGSSLASVVQPMAESLRNLAWLFALYRLFANDGRHASIMQVRPMMVALALVELLQPAMLTLLIRFDSGHAGQALTFQLSALFRLLVAVGGLVLVHNLYVGASAQTRLALRWPASALGLMWLFDLNFFTIAYLSGGSLAVLTTLRGLVASGMAVALALGAGRGSEELRFRPSRAVAFQSVSLLLIGGYLVAMVGIAQWLSYVGGDFATFMQLAFVATASVAALVVLPSRRTRGWLRVMLVKHFFQHRYDYRAEWLRFTRTIGQGSASTALLEERVVQAVADIADSPAGLLLTLGDHGQLVLAARWSWPTADVPAEALAASGVRFFERDGFIADLDDLRAGRITAGEDGHIPEWLRSDLRAWVLVPLLHFERLVGMVVLARPPHTRRLDWEDFDLLRVAGQQLASYLAEHAGQEALAEASRFDDFHRRIAFVMHDIKNLASQFSLLARNAELHAENPEVRSDMLVTLRSSADKLNALLARLSRYGPGVADALVSVPLDAVVQAVVEQFRNRHLVMLIHNEHCEVAGRRETLEQVLVHLVQNAVDASAPDSPVFISVSSDGLQGSIEVSDSGAGMSPEFVRTRLFKPFVSSKPGGFGIGAYEALELVRAMQGRLDVESREGLGSRFTVRLPLAATSEILKTLDGNGQKVA
jgi:putative PEP-CTERM system histidine kinase